jgi:hypothetical protein
MCVNAKSYNKIFTSYKNTFTSNNVITKLNSNLQTMLVSVGIIQICTKFSMRPRPMDYRPRYEGIGETRILWSHGHCGRFNVFI